MAGTLPRQLTPFVGRVAELDEIGEWLARERLVTLVGAGGIGKTRLALEAASRPLTASDAADEVRVIEAWFVDLAPVSAADEVATAVAAALRVQESATGSTIDALANVIADRAVMVVLDNCEHVVEACALLVEVLLRRCASLSVLATSREPLGVPGEVVWRVPSMTTPPVGATDVGRFDAVQLFLDRASRSRPGFAPSPSMLTTIGDLCRRLDGIALAVELAAAAVRVVAPDRIAEELDRRFAVLTGGPRTAVSRQQTLRACVEWSYTRLPADEQKVFRRLGVFSGAFPLEAAEVVAADDMVSGWAVFDAIAHLVDKSLVLHDADTGQYWLLETLRLYALDRCDAADELVATRAAHARWWHEWLMRSSPNWAADALDAIDAGYSNLRAALRWMVAFDRDRAHDITDALAPYWYVSGHLTDATLLADEVLDGGPLERPVRWARTVGALASAFRFAGRSDVSELVGRAAAIAADAGDHLTVLRCEVMDLRYRPDPSRLATQATRAEALGDAYLATRIMQTAGLFELLVGELDGVDGLLRRAEELTERERIGGMTGAHDLWKARALCRAEDYRGALELRVRSDLTGGRTSPYVALYGGVDQAWFATLLEDRTALDNAAAHVRAQHRDWGHHAPFVELLSTLPEIRAGAPPPAGLGAARDSADLAILAFPAWQWLLFDVLGPPSTVPVAMREHCPPVIADAYRALGAFVAGDATAACAAASKLVVHPREDRHIWLTLLACCEAGLGNYRLAARLLGAVAAFQRRAEIPWLPIAIRAGRERSVLECSAALGEPAFSHAYAEGEPLSLDDAAGLAARGRGERKRPSFGWDSLTPTEHRVVDLVGHGNTNAQIAGKLFMSTATVKTHLTHIFAKLNVSGRAELSAVAAKHS